MNGLFENDPATKETPIPAGIDRALSVLHGRDGEAILTLLNIHCDTKTPRILDCTHNKGTMWNGLSNMNVTSMDISDEFDVDVVGDFRAMPFADKSFDVIVFDPPHLPDHAGTGSRMHKAYAVGDKGNGRDHWANVSGIFQPFLLEAKRVLRKEGLILAKIADLVNAHCQQWQQVDFINAVRASRMTPCDMLIKIDPSAGKIADPRWKNVFHLRKSHCYWIVVRNSRSCERKKT